MLEGIQKILNSKSKMFLTFCFCFVLGVVFTSVFEFEKSLLFYFYILFWVLIVLFFLPPRPSATPPSKGGDKKQSSSFTLLCKQSFIFVLLCILFFILGIIRTLLFLPDINENHIAYYNGQTKEFVGKVIKEPDVRIDKSYYVVEAKEFSGRIKITTQLYPEYQYGDILNINCKLQKPENKKDSKFRYDKFLALEKVYSICYFPKINRYQSDCHSEESKNLLKEGDILRQAQDDSDVDDNVVTQCSSFFNSLYKKIFIFKSKIASQINLLWSEPEASFIAGLLYGYRGGFPESLQENFNKTGLTHIVAISGFNISIISIFLMTLLIYLGLYRKQSFWVTITGIFLFVVFVGSSASVVRAGVMGSLVLTAKYIGRPSRVFNIIILTLVLMLIINPLSLLWDVGFQLSFVAVLGLVYLSPIIEEKMYTYMNRIKHVHFLELIIKLLSATLSAIIVTLPLVLYHFERFSIVAPITNILVLWIIPWLMLFGFLSFALSFLFFPLGQILAWIVSVGLKYVIILVNWFGGKPWSSIEFTMPTYFIVILYLVLIWWYRNNSKK